MTRRDRHRRIHKRGLVDRRGTRARGWVGPAPAWIARFEPYDTFARNGCGFARRSVGGCAARLRMMPEFDAAPG